MEQNKTIKIIPDAIVIFSAGIVQLTGGGWRSTTYKESDAFGTLGGRDRVEAAALLAKKYPSAHLITTSHALGSVTPSIAEVYAQELRMLGVEEKRIVREGLSSNTQTAIDATLLLAQERGWKRLILLSSEYHLPRIAAFYKQAKSSIAAHTISSESVLIRQDPVFAGYFKNVKKTSAYLKRLEAEERGMQAITKGSYHSAPSEDKKERPM